MNAEHLVAAQRELRAGLLDHHRIAWHPARDLAARLLLHLDDAAFCWQFAALWLREALDADRVDGGFAGPGDGVYAPQAEARRSTRQVPSLLGASLNAADAGVRGVWSSARVVVFRDMAQEPRLGAGLRECLLAAGTRSKLAVALTHRGAPLGLLCADWMECRAGDDGTLCEHFQEVASVVLGPILAAARGLGMASSLLSELTPAERRVAQLAATGMSYKEIARRLDRSFSTIDHQLRSIRTKIGARSSSHLVHLLADQLAAGEAAPQAANGS